MQEKMTSQIEEWVNKLREELEKQTGRDDIEVTASPYCNYDVLVSAAADKHPIINFYSAIQGDLSRVKPALDYAIEMLQNWEATKVLHEKAKEDCLPFYEVLREKFPHLELSYNALDFDKHYLKVEKIADKILASFDLWPRMTTGDIDRLALYIREFEATLHREKATSAGMTYAWK